MSRRPRVVVFDVNETLSDMTAMGRRFEEVGVPAHTARLWFASLLRDGFALTAAGAQERFAALAEGALRAVLATEAVDRDEEDAIRHILGGIAELKVHPDVPEGVRGLRQAGFRLVTLSNGASSVAEQLLGDAGLHAEFEAFLSVEDAGAWKPARAAYEFAAQRCAVDVADLLLVAVHPWDTDGAARAGASAAWINRGRSFYPGYFSRPHYTARSLVDLADQLDRD